MQNNLLYIDPGSGSLIFQVVIAGILGALYFFKTSLNKIKVVSKLASGHVSRILMSKAIHPFLIGPFFILYNTKEVLILHSFSEVTFYTLIIAGFTTISYYALLFISQNNFKSAIILSAFLLMMLFYESIYATIKGLSFLQNNLPGMGYVIIPIFILLCAFTWLTKRDLARFNSYLNILMLLLLLYEGGTASYHYVCNISNLELAQGKENELKPAGQYDSPVIYHILLDAYTSSASLKKYWNFNNTELEDFLRSNGFYIASNAESNSNATQQSMATTFNKELLPNLDSIFTNEHLSTTAYRNQIRQSKVIHELTARKYTLINLSIFDLGDSPKFHKVGLLPDGGDLFDLLIRNTRFASYIKTTPYTNLSTNQAVFDSLQNLAGKIGGEKVFVYAHLNMPHDLYCDRNGKAYVNSTSDRADIKKRYLEGLIYTNSLLITTVKKILSDSKTPPVIIVHGDHGSRMFDESEKTTIFSAYYFPDKDYSELYDSISPINTYRVIGRKYFKENIRLLPDKKY